MPRHSWDDYLSVPYMNPSTLVYGQKSMKHLKHAWDEPNFKDSDDKLVGRAIHCHVYEPQEFYKRYCVYDDVRNERHKKYQDFLSQHPGKEVLSEKQLERVLSASSSLLKDKYFKRHMSRHKSGQPEVTLIAELFGVQFKGRVDWIWDTPEIDDLKTSKDIIARAFGRDFYDYGYDIKLALYREMFKWNTGVEVPVNTICIEKEPPYDVAIVPVPEAVLDRGLNKAKRIVDRMKECIEKNEWPGVANGEAYYLDTPPWEMDE